MTTRKIAGRRVMVEKGVKYRWLKVGEHVGDGDQYFDLADKSFQSTTNVGARVNHRRMYRHPLRFQRPVGCLNWSACLQS
jgi:hypothetical protein